MELFEILTELTVIAALFGYVNVRFLKLPSTIGLLAMALVSTVGILIIGQFQPSILARAEAAVSMIDFQHLLLDVMLSFLLFAGALHTKLDQLEKLRGPIIAFATLGVLISTVIIGALVFGLLQIFGLDVPFIYCLLFGALISPTDPIAVLGILRQVGAPKKLEAMIVGESLFNDGIGVVVFLSIFGIAAGSGHVSAGEIGLLFLEEVGGGIALGLLLGYFGYRLMHSVDHYETEVMLSLALVMGGYLLASSLHFSGPLAMVVAGLFIGNKARDGAWSDETELYLDKFWELLDVFLNAILFVLIGLELLIIEIDGRSLWLGILVIPITLFARFVALYGPIRIFRKRLELMRGTDVIMTWGGLRGGISIALALSLTAQMERDLFLTITYVVVIFSILVQGLSVGKVVHRFTSTG